MRLSDQETGLCDCHIRKPVQLRPGKQFMALSAQETGSWNCHERKPVYVTVISGNWFMGFSDCLFMEFQWLSSYSRFRLSIVYSYVVPSSMFTDRMLTASH